MENARLKELKSEILFRLEDYDGDRSKAERLLRMYEAEVVGGLFTKEELEIMQCYLSPLFQMPNRGEGEKIGVILEKLQRLTNLSSEGK